ncbi:MAG: ABC transporter permease [Clostridia bacterium]
MKKLKRFFGESYLALILTLLYLPILVIIVFSFSGNSNFTFSQGFTFSAYVDIFTSSKTQTLLSALKNTLFIAITSSLIATLLGTFAAVGMHYLGKRSKKLALSVNQLPMVNSEIVMAVSLMIFFVTFSFPQGYVRLILGHISFCTPYVVLSVMPRLAQMNPNLYEAALDLGVRPFKAMFKVIFPYVLPGVISGFVMAFTLSMDDFIITQINKGQTGIETLSTYIYEDARLKSLEPFWFAIFSILFVVVLALLLIANLKRSSKGKEVAV